MNLFALPSYTRALKKLPAPLQEEARAVALRLPSVFGRPHLHGGIGLRSIGAYYELRVGIRHRVLFLVESGDALLVFIGTHDEIRAYVKNR